MKKYNVAFLGSRPLSFDCLQFLLDRKDITVVAVVAPEATVKWWRSSLKYYAEMRNVPVVEQSKLKDLEIDWIFSVLYPQILSPDILNHPKGGCVNLHTGPLPRYRGRNGPAHAIMNARRDNYWKYGATMHMMDANLDTGDIIRVRLFPITETDTCWDVYHKTELAGLELFKQMVPKILRGKFKATKQEGRSYCYTKDSLDDKCLNIRTTSSIRAVDFVRAHEFPGFEKAYTELNGHKVYLSTKP